MDLNQLHERTGISRRKLRYCLDHNLVPGVQHVTDEVGRPRKFHDDVGFGILCAAKLLEQGLPHESIRFFLRSLMAISFPKYPNASVLSAICEHQHPARAHLGDGANVRLVVEEPAWDSKWFAPGNPAQLAPEYEPMVIVTLNLGRIYKKVLGSRD